jgi:hypothetical protein
MIGLWTVLLTGMAHAEEPEPGTAGGLEIGTGLRGTLSFATVALVVPRFAPHFDLRVGAIGMSATNWATFRDADTGEVVSLHPVVLGGTLYLGGASVLHDDLLRTYGGFEVLVGHSFTPYDAAFDTGNAIGPNVTLGFWGTFGFELLATEHHAVYVDGGGGFKTYRGLVDDEDPIAIGTAWLGSGVSLEVGTRLYL